MDKMDDVLRSYLNKKKPNFVLFTFNWKDIVGDDLAEHLKPVTFKAGILILVAKNPAWANEYTFYKNDIKNKINTFLKEDKVKEIRISGSGF